MPLSEAPSRAPRRIPFRADIEGVRAVALMLALFCHGGMTWAAGGFVGVDMFFVISGYLITSLLVAEGERLGSIQIGRFYAQRIKRLLPLSALVLVVVAAGSVLLLSPAQREVVSGDVLTGGLHVVNWHFAAESVDYFGPETAASPIMHYWSLSIEEQFYLVWALVLGAAVWAWSRSDGRYSLRRILLPIVVLITGASLGYSIIFSTEAPNAAYFSTLTRAWEIGAGALLALVALPPLRVGLKRILTWAGIGLVAYSVISFDATTIFPGAIALIPVLGVCALIAAGVGSIPTWPQRLLGSRPFVYLGGISYAWYLWHYPVMIFGLAYWGPLESRQTTALGLAAVVPAAITHHLIGQPLRYSQWFSRVPRRSYAIGATCTLAVVVSAAGIIAVTPKLNNAPADSVVGASTLKPPKLQLAAQTVSPAPTSKDARSDRGAIYEAGCLLEPPQTSSGECVFGEPAGRRTVVLFGDSHAMHWFGALERIAEQRGWRLVALTKAGCPPYDVTVYNGKVGREYTECDQWRQRTIERILERERPAIIFSGGSVRHRAVEDGKLLSGPANVARLERGYERVLSRFADARIRVVAFEDLPQSPQDMTDCVSAHLDDLRQCAFDKDANRVDHFEQRVAEHLAGVERFDLTPAICDRRRLCHGVIGNALVYRDDDHMTATFSRTLAPWIERALDRGGNRD